MKLWILLAVVAVFSSAQAGKKVVCYWGTWAVYRQGQGKFEVTDIDPTLCTHFVYSFLKAYGDGRVDYYDPYLDLPDNWGKGYIEKFVALKSKSPSTQFLMSIGGWTIGSAVFSQIASNAGARANFAKNVRAVVDKHKFDGFDFDWEYPSQRDGRPEDKQNFNLLLQELKNALSGKLLTIATASVEKSASQSYDIRKVCEIVDFVNLMTYDLHGSWDGKTGINAPLHCRNDDNPAYCIDTAVKFWIDSGCPREKLVVGAPIYGRSFTLHDPNNNGLNSPAGAGNAGVFVPEQGFLGYMEICYNLKNGWTRRWEDTQKVPYAFKGNQWVGYDDEESLKLKLKFVKDNNLGGIMFWSIETDDFKNLCGKGKYPMLTAAKNAMQAEPEVERTFAFSGTPIALPAPPPSPQMALRENSFVSEQILVRFKLNQMKQRNFLKILKEIYENREEKSEEEELKFDFNMI